MADRTVIFATLACLAGAAAAHAQERRVTTPALPLPSSTETPPTRPGSELEVRVRVVPPEPPAYAFTLHDRQACVTPSSRKLARADGGFIDVTTPPAGGVTVAMTGTTAANSYLGCTGAAGEHFRLLQEFEITSNDPKVKSVVLTLDTSLVGFVRSKGRASAAVRRAEVSVVPANWEGSPLAQSYPCFSSLGTQGRSCNQHQPPSQGPPMPLGRYTLAADLVLDTQASGICDAHAVADFSPDTTLPADWVRTRDPFQGVSKKAFGFAISLSASTPAESGGQAANIRTRTSRPPEPIAPPRVTMARGTNR